MTLAQASYLRRLGSCLVCGNDDLRLVLDLGEQYLADFLDAPDASHPKAPLRLMACESCWLMQLSHVVDRDKLFRNYWYKSGVNATMVAHLTALAGDVLARLGLKTGDKVVDIGANDGTFLSKLPANVHKIAFEPATNLQDALRPQADEVIPSYFDADKVAGKVRLVTSLAMFYDLERPVAFAADIQTVLARNGVWVCEMNYLGSMLKQTAFDFMVHEHVALYFLSTFNKVIGEVGLQVFDVEENDINGGSFRLWIGHRGSRPIRTSVDHFLYIESQMRNTQAYTCFATKAQEVVATVHGWVSEVRGQGGTVYAYGASTRGMTLLQATGLDATPITKAVDKNPEKVGKFMAGVDIPIVSETTFRAEHPHYLLVLPWGFADEFAEREKDYLKAGGRMIVPLPEPKVVGG